MAGVALVHLAHHPVPAHRTFQAVLDAPGQNLAPAVTAPAADTGDTPLITPHGHSVQSGQDEALNRLSLSKIIGSKILIYIVTENVKASISTLYT